MRCLRSGCRGRQIFMSLYNRWLVIPAVLKKKVITNGCLILCILAAGIFMEWNNGGEGFLKLTAFCIVGLGVCFLFLFWTIDTGKYKAVEGEIIRIEICKCQKKYWSITVRDKRGREEVLVLPIQNGIHKGGVYRFYWKNESFLGMEELGILELDI